MDATTLLIQVSAIFETESFKLGTDQFGQPILTVESWEKINKMLSLIDFPEQPPLQTTFSTNLTAQSPCIHLELNKTERLIENVYELSFINFYPNIIISLNLDFPEIKAYRFIVENKFKQRLTIRGYYTLKSWVNFYYGMLGKNFKAHAETVTGTGAHIMDKMMVSMGNDLIYVDVDSVFFTNTKNFTSNHTKLDSIKSYADYIGLPYEIERYEGAMFFGKKKYILFKKMEGVNIKGFKKINFGI